MPLLARRRAPLVQQFYAVCQVLLYRHPVGRTRVRQFLQRLAMGRDRLLQFGCPATAFAKRRQRIAEIVLRNRPGERIPLSRVSSFSPSRCPSTASSTSAVPLLRLPSVHST